MANWSAIGALGEAAKASGDYFGVLAVEKTRTQRLAEARAEQLADAATARTQQLEDIDAKQKNDKIVYEGKREDTTEDAVAGELRRDGIAAKRAESNNLAEIEEWDRQRGITSGEWSHSSGNTLVKGDIRLEMFTNKDGKVMYQKATRNAEGTVVPASSGEVDSSLAVDSVDAPQQDSQSLAGFVDPDDSSKDMTVFGGTIALRKQTAKDSLEEMDAILYDPDDPYDMRSGQAGWDQVMLGGITNPLASAKGQKFTSAAGRVREAFLRTATGAAAPETEVGSYKAMYTPQWGDHPDTVAMKMAASKRQIEAMHNLAQRLNETGETLSEEDANLHWRMSAKQIAEESGLAAHMADLDKQAESNGRTQQVQDYAGRWVLPENERDQYGKLVQGAGSSASSEQDLMGRYGQQDQEE
jgi:hypothetical protein